MQELTITRRVSISFSLRCDLSTITEPQPPFPEWLFSPTSRPLVPRRDDLGLPLPPEILIFVGYPASGKTSLYNKHFKPAKYAYIVRPPPRFRWKLLTSLQSMDNHKRHDKCIDEIRSCLARQQSCVVDGTNPSVANRKRYIDAFPFVRIRAFYFEVPIDLVKHNSVYRALDDPSRTRLVVRSDTFDWFEQNLEIPTQDEGVFSALPAFFMKLMSL